MRWMTTRRPWRPAGLALALCALAVGCDDSEQPAESAGAGCVSDLEFFQQQVSLPVLEADCVNCHNPQGIANQSMLVLASAGETDYLRRNFEVLREVAAFERDGVNLLRGMPTNQIPHGGGQRFKVGSDTDKAFQELIRRFDAPVVCEASSEGSGLLAKVELVDLPGTLRKAKLQLIGELPTVEELEQVSSGGAAALEALLTGYMQEDAFYETLKRWWNDDLLTDKYARGDEATNLLDSDDFPRRHYYRDLPDDTEAGQLARRWSNLSVAREPLELIAHVVRSERPFSEVLTADYMLLNPFSAQVYGLDTAAFDDPLNPMEFKALKVDGVPHAGVLTSPMFLNRYPTTPTNRNRHRARTVYRLFLATDILQKADRPVDPTQIRDHNPTMNNPQCTVCHASMDPVAGAFQNWDDRGRYRLPEEGWFSDMRPPGFEADMPPDDWGRSLQWLAGQIAADERFALSAVYAVYTGLVGRRPLTNPQDQSDPRFEAKLAFYNEEQAFLRTLVDAFQAGGQNLKVIIPLVIESPFYRALNAPGLSEDEAVVLAPLGTARLLTPEELSAKLVATLGRPWQARVNDRDQLTHRDEFLFFIGGIDSDQITDRISEPNGIMANIALRMASDMACLVTAEDFNRPLAERHLFPLVEASYRPEDDNGFAVPQAEEAIRANIRYLHQRLLGEVLTPGHPEEDATYELYLQTWRELFAGIRNEQVPTALPGRCRHERDFWSDEALEDDARLRYDPEGTLRAWHAVLTYLLADWRFLYHQ
ncbi:MAG: DUF1588 domain-containing protein [Myxococcales bacterium]|nr:DUF1588 domain-containing protein [Myxococcales bacterium]